MAVAKKQSLYVQIVERGDDVLKAMGYDRTQRADKRAFESAYDDLLAKKDAIETKKEEFYKKVGKYNDNLSNHLKTAWEQRDINDSIDMLKEEYLKIFGEAFKVRS